MALFPWTKKKTEPQEETETEEMTVDKKFRARKRAQLITKVQANTFQTEITDYKITEEALSPDGKMMVAMDSSVLQQQKIRSAASYTGNFGGGLNDTQLEFYGTQGFIGYQACAMLAQNWLINKACVVPANDAVRNGYEITANEGVKVDPKLLADLKEMDKEFKINDHMIDFIHKGKIFGIRIAMFNVDGIDYEKPFNIDGVKPNSYKGITQIDPYWITPELDISSASDPSSPTFYKPTWWRINGNRVHYSHLVIYIPNPVADILKPSYIFGGPGIPQLIYTRVYAAEKCANEAPLLLLTKRANILHCDMAQAMGDQAAFESRLNFFAYFRDNFGIKTINTNETMEQFETSLANVDETIMTQFQITAAVASMPATKILETTPKGFSSTGEYEEASYHETLESLQCNNLNPFLDRHHELCIASRIAPDKDKRFKVTVAWETLDSPTAAEKAKVRKMTADADEIYVEIGALDGEDVRARLITDPESGYNGLGNETDLDDENELPYDEEGNPIGGANGNSIIGEKTVQQISMNGPQILALIQIMGEIAAKQLPPETAKAIIAAGFSTLTKEQIDAMVDPMKAVKTPPTQAPAGPDENPQTPNAEKAS